MNLWFREEKFAQLTQTLFGWWDQGKGILWKSKQVGMALLFLQFSTYTECNYCDFTDTFFFTKLTTRFVDILNGHPKVMALWVGMRARITHQCDAGSVLGLLISESGNRTRVTMVGDPRSRPCIIADSNLRAQCPLTITRRKHTLVLNWCNASFGSPVNISG